MNKDNLKEELQPYYEKGDCCSWIVELRKSNAEKDKEIERLSKEVDIWNRKYNEQIDIIKELEKYINKEFYVVGNSPKGSFYEGYDTCLEEMKQEILNKLKALKEGKHETK